MITFADPRVEELIAIKEEIGARSPGWYCAVCLGERPDGGMCYWTTTGTESVVEDAAIEHVHEAHLELAETMQPGLYVGSIELEYVGRHRADD